MKKDRLVWADLLRISACIMVIGIHTSGQFYYLYERLSAGWWISVAINSLGHFAVPSFFMLSGMFMLDPNRGGTIKHIYTHSIPKMIELIIFSIIVSIGVVIVCRIFGAKIEYTNDAPIHTIFWLMIMYSFTPALRCIAKERDILKYSIVVLVVLTVIISPIRCSYVSQISTVISEAEKLVFSLTFYLLGYYLNTTKCCIKTYNLVIGIIIGYIIHFVELYIGMDNKDFILNRIDSNSTIQFNTICISVCVFLLFRNIVSKFRLNDRIAPVINMLAISTMYIYVTHMGILKLLNKSGLLSNSAFQVPFWIIINFFISLIIALIYIKSKTILKLKVYSDLEDK